MHNFEYLCRIMWHNTRTQTTDEPLSVFSSPEPKTHGWAIESGIRPSTISNIFSSETTVPIKLKFHIETPLDAGMKVCSNGPGHMNKMVAMNIYGKNPLKGFSKTRRPITLGLSYWSPTNILK